MRKYLNKLIRFTKSINMELISAFEGNDTFLFRGLLPEKHFPQLDFLLSQAEFVDGRATASDGAKLVKNNLQINAQDQVALPSIQQLITQALMAYPLFHAALMPTRLYPLMISKYEPGMGYGWHVDSPLMGGNPPVRTDLAMTLFLSDPADYVGGELVIKSANGVISYKPEKGDAVVYPCQYVHCVNDIQAGVRLAAITWIQSSVRSLEQRQLLFQLKQTHDQLIEQDPSHPQAAQLLQIWSNLLRMWMEV